MSIAPPKPIEIKGFPRIEQIANEVIAIGHDYEKIQANSEALDDFIYLVFKSLNGKVSLGISSNVLAALESLDKKWVVTITYSEIARSVAEKLSIYYDQTQDVTEEIFSSL